MSKLRWLLFLLAVAMLGWQIWWDYFRLMRTFAGLFDALGAVSRDMHNFKGTLALMLGNDQSRLINLLSYGALIAAAVVTLWLWRKRWQPGHPSFELRMALTLLLGLLFSLHSRIPQSFGFGVPTAALFFNGGSRHLVSPFASFNLLSHARSRAPHYCILSHLHSSNNRNA